MSCALKVFSHDVGDYVRYSCTEVRELQESWKREFREKNETDKIFEMGLRDPYYERFCKHIDEFLDKCKCKKNG